MQINLQSYLTIIHVEAKVNIFPQLILNHKAMVAIKSLTEVRIQERCKWLHTLKHQPVRTKLYNCATLNEHFYYIPVHVSTQQSSMVVSNL